MVNSGFTCFVLVFGCTFGITGARYAKTSARKGVL